MSLVLALAIAGTALLLTGTSTSTARLALLGLGIAGAVVTWSLARALTDEDSHRDSLWGPLLRIVTRLVPWVLAAGTVAGALGSMVLAEQLIYGGLIGAVVPLLLAATDKVLRALVGRAVERPPLTWLRAVRRYPDAVLRRTCQAIDLLLLVVGARVFAQLFPFLRPLLSAVYAALGTKLAVGGLSVSLLDVLTLGIGITVAALLARLVRFLLEEDVLPRTTLTAGASAATSRLVYYALVGIGVFMAVAAAGFELSQLTLLVSALGVGIGFGLQNIVSNFVSGIVLAFERPIQPGDQVAVGSMTGRVRDIGLRATVVSTADGADVIVPNSQLITNEVVNWTLADRSRRIDLPVSVVYGTDLRYAQQVLGNVLRAQDGVAQTPEPVVIFRRFGEKAVEFSLLFWVTDQEQSLPVTSDVGLAVWDALNQAGIGIPFPPMDSSLRPSEVPVNAATEPAAHPRSGGSPPAAAGPRADPA
jgi:potassium-dependent mechanosensitive channel